MNIKLLTAKILQYTGTILVYSFWIVFFGLIISGISKSIYDHYKVFHLKEFLKDAGSLTIGLIITIVVAIIISYLYVLLESWVEKTLKNEKP